VVDREGRQPSDREAADRLLEKVRTFVAEQLDDQEAALFAALVAPGIAEAYMENEVVGFDSEVDWRPGALPDSLTEAVRSSGIRVEGLGE